MAYKKLRRKKNFFERNSLTNVLIAINVILFFIFLLIINIQPSFLETIALTPEDLLEGRSIWTIFTSMFMHAGFFHLFVNMFTLFFLGNLTEKIIGGKRFLWLYLISGISGALFFVVFAYLGQFIPRGDFIFGGLTDSAVGASGALFGLLGILAMLLPKKEVYLIAGPIIVIILQFTLSSILPEGIANTINLIGTVIIFVMLFSLFSFNRNLRRISIPIKLKLWLAPIIAIAPLVIIGLFVKLPIGNTAHFGGLVIGLIYGAYLRNKYSRKVKMLNRMIR